MDKYDKWFRIFVDNFKDRFEATPNKWLLLEFEIKMLEYLTQGKWIGQWENIQANLQVFTSIQAQLPDEVKSLTPSHLRQFYNHIALNGKTDDFEIFDDLGRAAKNTEDVVIFISVLSTFYHTIKKALLEAARNPTEDGTDLPNILKIDIKNTPQKGLIQIEALQRKLKGRLRPPKDTRVPQPVIGLYFVYLTNSNEIHSPVDWDEVAAKFGYSESTSWRNIRQHYYKFSYPTNRVNLVKNPKSNRNRKNQFKQVIAMLENFPKAKQKAEEDFQVFTLKLKNSLE